MSGSQKRDGKKAGNFFRHEQKSDTSKNGEIRNFFKRVSFKFFFLNHKTFLKNIDSKIFRDFSGLKKLQKTFTIPKKITVPSICKERGSQHLADKIGDSGMHIFSDVRQVIRPGGGGEPNGFFDGEFPLSEVSPKERTGVLFI
jgi:hypothetical protein